MKLVSEVVVVLAILVVMPWAVRGEDRQTNANVRVVERDSYTEYSRSFEADSVKVFFSSRYYAEDAEVDVMSTTAVLNLISVVGAKASGETMSGRMPYIEHIWAGGETERTVGSTPSLGISIVIERYPPDDTTAIMVLRQGSVVAAVGKNASGGFDLSDNKALREKIIAFNPGAEETLPEDWNVKDMAKTPGKHPRKEDGKSEKSVGGEDAESEPQSTRRIDKRRKEYKQSTPRELLESFVEAGETNDYRGLLCMFHPDARKAAKPLMEILAAQKEVVEELGHVVRDKVDEELGDKIIEAVREGAGGPFEDGAIRWDRVNIHRQGDKATVTIEGKAGTAVFTKVDGNWYLDPSERDLEGMLAEYESAQKWTSRGMDAIRQLIHSVRAGRIQTVEEFKRHEARALDKAFGKPLPEPEEESGPSVRRAPKDPIEDLEKIRQQP